MTDESLGSNNSIANSSEDNAVGYSEEKGSKCALSVKATGRVAGYERKGHYGTIQTPNPESRNMDEDEISTQLLLQDINLQDSLSEAQKAKLLNLVHKYKPHFTKKPGKCNCFKYRFELQGGLPKSRNSRPIPFALRKEVQEQIQEMLANNIIEESYSSYVNPLTLVERDGKRVRICLDAREVNKFMRPDRAKVPPMQMLLQRFHGANCISSLDLSSAFLQIPLEKSSRQ